MSGVEVDAPARWRREASVVRRTGQRVIDIVMPGCSAAFRLVGTAEMTTLNRQWRRKDGPTDVLSWTCDDDEYLGDVALCVPVARQQARAFGHSLDVELAVLTVHALGHLCGLDHERSAAEARLQAEIEMGWLALVGVSPEGALTRRGMPSSRGQ